MILLYRNMVRSGQSWIVTWVVSMAGKSYTQSRMFRSWQEARMLYEGLA